MQIIGLYLYSDIISDTVGFLKARKYGVKPEV